MPKHFVKQDGTVSIYSSTTASVGRPSTYTEDIGNHAVSLSKIGLNNHQISQELEIKWGTFSRWLEDLSGFRAKLDKNRNLMLKNAEKCIGKRIEGFTYKEKKVTETQIYITDEEGNSVPIPEKKVKTEIVEVHVPPDVKAAMYVLDRRSKFYKKQPDAIEESIAEPITVVVKEIEPPKKKVIKKSAKKEKKVVAKSVINKKVRDESQR